MCEQNKGPVMFIVGGPLEVDLKNVHRILFPWSLSRVEIEIEICTRRIILEKRDLSWIVSVV